MTNVGDTFEAIVAGADIDAEEHENNYSRISDFFSGLVADANITLTGSITGETLSDGTASITGGVGTGFSSITSTLFTGALTGNVTGNVSGSSGSCSGLSATATALATARNIAGVAFDGTANISLNNNAITNGAGYTTNVGDLVSGGALGTPSSGTLTNCTFPTLNQNTTGQAGTVATIAGLAPDTATTQATQPNVTSIANLATVGTITTGVWNAGAVTSSGGISATTGTFSDDVGITGKISLNDGGSSVFVGEGAGLNDDGTDNRNVGVGHYSLLSNTTGSNNTANGYKSLYFNTTGSNNTANGYKSLFSNTTGSNNTATGYLSLRANTTGSYNTANGMYSFYNSGKTLTAGSFITGVSYTIISAGDTDFTVIGSANNNVGTVFTATGAGTGTGTASANVNNNIALGYQAGRYFTGTQDLTAPSNSTFLGYDTKALADGGINEIVIGYEATGIGSNTVTLGNDSIVTTALKGNVGIGTARPSHKLEVFDGDVGITSDSKKLYFGAGDDFSQYFDGTDQQFNLTSGDFLFNGGNVGIGTPNPGEKLEVNGNIKATQIKAIHKTADGTSAVADGNYVIGIGNDTNGSITIKDGLITSITEAS